MTMPPVMPTAIILGTTVVGELLGAQLAGNGSRITRIHNRRSKPGYPP